MSSEHLRARRTFFNRIKFRFSNADEVSNRFFREAPPSLLTSVVQKYVTKIGTFSVSTLPVSKKIGRNNFFLGEYKLNYLNGAIRDMYAAVTFNRGYFYYLYFFAPSGSLVGNRDRFDVVLSSLELTSN
jgi:hypothetical protein